MKMAESNWERDENILESTDFPLVVKLVVQSSLDVCIHD